MTDSEAFKKRKKKIAKIIVADYAIDKREERYRREDEERERYKNAIKRISLLLINNNERKISLYIKNAKK